MKDIDWVIHAAAQTAVTTSVTKMLRAKKKKITPMQTYESIAGQLNLR